MRVSSPDMAIDNKNEKFFFTFLLVILNVGFSQNFSALQLTKVNLTQPGKYFIYEDERMLSISQVKQETKGKLFSYNSS